MSTEVVFLAVEHVLAIHQRVIDEFGGSGEIRDRGLLESAVGMPSARFGGQYLHDDLPAMAAAYLFHLCRNHPFVDGNKRTAWASAEIFLLLNGVEVTAVNDQLEKLTLGIAEGSTMKDEAVNFFRNSTQAR